VSTSAPGLESYASSGAFSRGSEMLQMSTSDATAAIRSAAFLRAVTTRRRAAIARRTPLGSVPVK
jgi:hypothetical protein